MENNSIREFTCNDCQEVTKVDWSKVRPDLDDGTSNICITFDDGKYIYVGECDNCGNLVEIEPPVPELKVDNIDVNKYGMDIQLTDTVTNRSCWIDAWKNKNGEWEYDFNQYIFHLDDDNDVIAKMFQEDLGNYAEEVFDCVMEAINEHEDVYNKLQESKAPTMRDRLKETKRNKCTHKKTEALVDKKQEAGVCPVCGNTDLDYGDTTMEQVGDYFGYNWKCSKCNHTGTEWYYMSFADVYNTYTGEESHQEGICPDCGSDLMYDNFVAEGMDGYYEVCCDNCGFTGKEDYNLDFSDHTINEDEVEEITESKKVEEDEDVKSGGFVTVRTGKKYSVENAANMIDMIYDILYDNENKLREIIPNGIEPFLDLGDKLIKEHNPVVKKLVNARGDLFTSDREVTALGMFYNGITNQDLTIALVGGKFLADEKLVITENKTVKIESVSWDYFDKFEKVVDKYLPRTGEGDTLATQIVTAINNLIYHWYNDGDVYDNVHSGLEGGANDFSSCANWLCKYVDGAQEILSRINNLIYVEEYERILATLATEFLDEGFLETVNKTDKKGTIYECDGPFEFREGYSMYAMEEGYTRINPDKSYNLRESKKVKKESKEDLNMSCNKEPNAPVYMVLRDELKLNGFNIDNVCEKDGNISIIIKKGNKRMWLGLENGNIILGNDQISGIQPIYSQGWNYEEKVNGDNVREGSPLKTIYMKTSETSPEEVVDVIRKSFEKGYDSSKSDTNNLKEYKKVNKKTAIQKKTEADMEDVEVNNAGGFYKDNKYYLGDPNAEYDEVEYGDNIEENLWTAACCGDNKYLQNYYNNGGKPNVRHNGFGGSKVSLIIGALNNKCWDTIELLKNNGETILKSELPQYKRLMAEHNYEDDITKSAMEECKEVTAEYKSQSEPAEKIAGSMVKKEESKKSKLEDVIEKFKEACNDLIYNEETGQYDDSYDRYFEYKQQLLDLGMTEEEVNYLEDDC